MSLSKIFTWKNHVLPRMPDVFDAHGSGDIVVWFNYENCKIPFPTSLVFVVVKTVVLSNGAKYKEWRLCIDWILSMEAANKLVQIIEIYFCKVHILYYLSCIINKTILMQF